MTLLTPENLKRICVLGTPGLKENGKKTKEDTKEYHQLKKYLNALNVDTGVLINFPFPPEKKPEIIEEDDRKLKI